MNPETIGSTPSHNIYIPTWDKVVNRRSVLFNETLSHNENRSPEAHNNSLSGETLEPTTAFIENDDVSKDPFNSDIASNDNERAVRVRRETQCLIHL
jgi:hypothetical protein